jgi:hypothetical protein
VDSLHAIASNVSAETFGNLKDSPGGATHKAKRVEDRLAHRPLDVRQGADEEDADGLSRRFTTRLPRPIT